MTSMWLFLFAQITLVSMNLVNSWPMTARTANMPQQLITNDDQVLKLAPILPREALIAEEIQEALEGSQENSPQYSGHLVALRPDYNLWNMMNVLRNVFDGRAKKQWL